ncbi:torso-like protein isoform X1 [Portunus trituberculatus]|uniref:torso-like protein isoform X1 n=1 Tax=Portunus trituberculatus TaxID=210409 RepID=UPI001E1D13B7|nr:torso-like protein isoform X1 [Portunus trituberculatus]
MEAINSTVCNAVRSHLSACEATDMGGAGAWAALVVAVCVMCSEGEGGVAPSTAELYENELGSNDYLKVGRSLNLLPRFGFLSLSIKVFPEKDSNYWLFRERTVEVFRKNSYWAVKNHGQPSSSTQSPRRPYDPHFVVDFCDNVQDLLTAYFDNFYIEGVPEPHRIFTSSISVQATAKHLGIHPTYLRSMYSFVLVRLLRRNSRATLDGQLALTSSFKSATSRIRVGSTESVNQFLDQYGTHVITEYEVGDVLYQVYVFGNRTYWDFKNNFAMSTTEDDLIRMERYFSPSHALYVGNVKLASGNPHFEEAVQHRLLEVTHFRLYNSIFQIFKIPDLEERLEQLDGQVVIGLKLEKITKIVPKSPERHWLGEILDNTLSLFYVTM